MAPNSVWSPSLFDSVSCPPRRGQSLFLALAPFPACRTTLRVSGKGDAECLPGSQCGVAAGWQILNAKPLPWLKVEVAN